MSAPPLAAPSPGAQSMGVGGGGGRGASFDYPIAAPRQVYTAPRQVINDLTEVSERASERVFPMTTIRRHLALSVRYIHTAFVWRVSRGHVRLR
jgi:hypothetical protein